MEDITAEEYLSKEGYTLEAIVCYDSNLTNGNIDLKEVMEGYTQSLTKEIEALKITIKERGEVSDNAMTKEDFKLITRPISLLNDVESKFMMDALNGNFEMWMQSKLIKK